MFLFRVFAVLTTQHAPKSPRLPCHRTHVHLTTLEAELPTIQAHRHRGEVLVSVSLPLSLLPHSLPMGLFQHALDLPSPDPLNSQPSLDAKRPKPVPPSPSHVPAPQEDNSKLKEQKHAECEEKVSSQAHACQVLSYFHWNTSEREQVCTHT
jgi:hypothetical protein